MLRKPVMALFVGAMTLGLMGKAYSESEICTKSDRNLAFGRTVAVTGEFFTGGWGDGLLVEFATLTDGVLFPKGHQWDQGPIWWEEDMDDIQNCLTVHLGRTCEVHELTIQVDNSDDYIISWEDVKQGHREVKVIPNIHWGMDAPIVLGIDAITNAFRIEHDVTGAGDGLYSVSEFQAIGRCLKEKIIKPPTGLRILSTR
ncbi:MAG: hypothetical protein IMF20_05910 [Proteobacteria bacterium]|nr:hypothetical protein [Pseudomonadota bacterium]